MKRKQVAATATQLDRGIACFIPKPNRRSIIGMLLPAPDRPAALLMATSMNIKTSPIDWETGWSAKVKSPGLVAANISYTEGVL